MRLILRNPQMRISYSFKLNLRSSADNIVQVRAEGEKH